MNFNASSYGFGRHRNWARTGVVLLMLTSMIVTAPASHAGSASATVGNGLTTTDLNALGMSAATLANQLIDPASGITGITNVQFSGSKNQAGSIHLTDPNVVSFNNGVILSSGNVADVVGPNKSNSTTTDENGPNDSDLDQLILNTQTVFPSTYDATSLAFDFTAPAGAHDLYFTYVFGSDEYLEWVNLYNDVFGLFVNGTNCAVAPNPTDPALPGVPVSIDTINSSVNSNLFRDNAYMSASNPLNFESDGLSVEMVCHATIAPGLNHIKFAIADTSDRVLDSIVMIKTGSFSTTPIESCNNGIDDDNNGLSDMNDDYCKNTTTAAPAGTSSLPTITSGSGLPLTQPVVAPPTPYNPTGTILTPPFTGNEGAPILLDANFKGWKDTNATVATSWTVKLKSNNTVTCQVFYPNVNFAGRQPHIPGTPIELASAICPQDGEYVARVDGWDATSGGGSEFDYDIDFFVHNAPPQVDVDYTLTPTSAELGQSVNFAASVLDPGGDATTCSINWGDGETSTPLIADGKCEDIHTYISVGTKVVSVKATDNANATAAAVASITILNAPVVTVPDSPTVTSVIATDSSAELMWDAPVFDGGAPIDYYNVFQSETFDGVYVASSSSCQSVVVLTCIADGLTNGTTYFFKVTAHNSVGDSLPSSESVAVTPLAAPLNPTFDTATPTADGFTLQITNYDGAFTWATPTVTSGSVAITSTSGPTRVLTVTGLAPGESATVTQGTTRTGYASGSNTSPSVSALNATITHSVINGLIVPVTDATPVSAIAEDSQFTGTVVWSGAPVTFPASTSITATVTLTPKPGYSTYGISSNFFSVAGASSVTNSANSALITVVFPSTAAAMLPPPPPPPIPSGGGFFAPPALSSDATLSKFTVNGIDALSGLLIITVENVITSVEIIATASDSGATVLISGNSNLMPGKNLITVKVTAADSTAKVYTVGVVVKPAAVTPTPAPDAFPTTTPTPSVPSVQTPTPTPTSTKVLGGGVTQFSGQISSGAAKPSVAKPATSLAKAPQVTTVTGQLLAPVVKSLPKSAKFSASLVINGKAVSLGSVTTDAKGSVTMPTISASRAGSYVVQLASSSGGKFFIKVLVKAK